MKLVLCFTVLSSFLLLNDGFAVRSAVKCGNNRLKSTQLNLFGRKKAVADAVVQTTVTTGKQVAAGAAVSSAVTGKQVAAGAAVSSAATCGNGGLCGILSSIKLKFMNIFTSLIALNPAAKVFLTVLIGLVVFGLWLQRASWVPSRTYNREENSVGREYDSWTSEGILEYYWGEHIHLGYYNDEERANGYKKKNFIQAKYDFIDKMALFGKVDSVLLDGSSKKILDVGCGIGGTSRYLAKKYTNSAVTGITLSSEQVKRATELASDRGINNVKFQVMDALAMTFPDNSFDIVWACESGEHMPDKKKYVEEMTRVLKPGGRIVIATWCQRDENNKPFNDKEKKMLNFLYSEWTHPFFISISDYAKLMFNTKKLKVIQTDDWAKETIPSWRHSIWVGVFDPWPVVRRPHLWYKVFRDAITLERMHQAFTDGLMQYGMMTAVKPTK